MLRKNHKIQIDSTAKDRLYNICLSKGDRNSECIVEYYEKYKDFLDLKFVSQMKDDFPACMSELYFCHVFIERLNLEIMHASDKGPDFYLPKLKCWAEIVTATHGKQGNINSIAPEDYDIGTGYEVPVDKIKLRFSTCLGDKFKKISKYIEEKTIDDDKPVVICVSGGWLCNSFGMPINPVGGLPEIAQVLYGCGNLVYHIGRNSRTILGSEIELKMQIPKLKIESLSEPINIGHFQSEKYAQISAVIYSWKSIFFNFDPEKIGNDFVVMHNPFAKNPLERNAFNCGIEHIPTVHDDSIAIEIVNHEKPSQANNAHPL